MATVIPAPEPERKPLEIAGEADSSAESSAALVRSIGALTEPIRDLVARSPVSPEELLTAEQLGELFSLSPRTLRDLAAARLVPHHRPAGQGVGIQAPLKEVGGVLKKYGQVVGDGAVPVPPARRARQVAARKGRTKTPTGTRSVELPPSIAVFYEMLLDSHPYPFVFTTPEGRPWRRSNFRQRFWRPVWDGVQADEPMVEGHIPAILPWFTFQEGRHTHATWLTEDGIPEIARRARLGQKMKCGGRRVCSRSPMRSVVSWRGGPAPAASSGGAEDRLPWR